MDWQELHTIVRWWAMSKVLDIAWEWLLVGTLMTQAGSIYARYKDLPFQREVRGAAIGVTIITFVVMASLLASRSVSTLPCKGTATMKNGIVTVRNACIRANGLIVFSKPNIETGTISAGQATFLASNVFNNEQFMWSQVSDAPGSF